MRLSSRKLAAVLAAALAQAGCSGGEVEPSKIDVTCGAAKCDGFGSLDSLMADAKKADTGDFLSVGFKLASDEFNRQLAKLPFGTIQITPPKAFTTAEAAANDLTMGNLDELVSGLAAQFGERELSTQVNRIRRDALRAQPGHVFAESALRLGADLKLNWNFDVGGWNGAALNVGFSRGKTQEARVIGMYPSETNGLLNAPLDALQKFRGFILPRSYSDLIALRAGESFVLSGEGHTSFNLGAGVPLLVAEPTAGLTYNLVFSANYRTRVFGQLDVQVIRLEGDQIVIDVGMRDGKVTHASIAMDDRWGATGLLKSHIDIGGVGVDLGRLAEKALQKVLNDKLNLVSGKVSYDKSSGRLAVARFRVSANAIDPNGPVAKAIELAMGGELRDIQALANKGEPGVVSEFDISKSGTSKAFFAGIELFGMKLFYEKAKSEGNIVIQTPGGIRSLLYQSLHEGMSPLFGKEHGYTRVGLGGLIIEDGNAPRNEANFYLNTYQGMNTLSRRTMLNHLDGVIGGVVGPAGVLAIEQKGNELQRVVSRECHVGADETVSLECVRNALTMPEAVELKAGALADLRDVAQILSPELLEVVMKAGQMRLSLQAKYEIYNPKSKVEVGLRLDDEALKEMMTRQGGGWVFRESVLDYLKNSDFDRWDQPDTIAQYRASVEEANKRDLEQMANVFDEYAQKYRGLLQGEAVTSEATGPIGARAIEVRYSIDSSKRVDYEQVAARSFAAARSATLVRMFDKLYDKADFSLNAEQVIMYGLMGMQRPEKLDVALSVRWKSLNDLFQAAGYGNLDVYGKGTAVKPIEAGVFDIDELIK